MPALSEKQIDGNKLEESHKVTENACFNYRDACMCVYIYIYHERHMISKMTL